MKIKTDKKGKKFLAHPSQKEKMQYKTFNKDIIDPTRTDGRLYFQPKVRGFRAILVPHLDQTPCDVCASAQYNRLCTNASFCIPMLYVTLNQVAHIEDKKLITKGTKSCIVKSATPTGNTKKTRSATSVERG